MKTPVYRVRTFKQHHSITGSDSCIATVPPGVYGPDGAIDVRRLGKALCTVSEEAATRIHETLHHAEWVITTDPDVIEKIGMHGRPDCASCRSSVDQALAAVKDHPEGLLVGALYWAGS